MKKFLKVLGVIAIIIVILFALLMFMPDDEEYAEDYSNGGSQTTSQDVEVVENKAATEVEPGQALSEGNAAPDFTAQLANGASFTLSDYSDKCVLINFWATWCGPCVGEMPAFQQLLEDNIDGLEIICINCMEDEATVDKFVNDNGYTFNIAYDTNGNICANYPTDGIPYTLVVNKGRIENIYVGAMDAETQYREYLGAIEACLGE